MQDNSGVPPWNGPPCDSVPVTFSEARSLKRELLEELRSGWEEGAAPPAEELLDRWPGDKAKDPDVASLLFEEYWQRQQRASKDEPTPDVEEYEKRFPQQKDSLAGLFQHQAWLQSLRGGGGTDRVSGSSLRLALPSVGDELFDFRLGRELGRGAFARVFVAEQKDLADRPVVLKVSAIDGDEPQTLAQLQHTHIVPIYSVHEDPRAGLRAVCMPYFGGASLSTVLKTLWLETLVPNAGQQLVAALATAQQVREEKDEGGRMKDEKDLSSDSSFILHPSSFLEELEALTYVQASAWVVARLAEALEHAHARGVLHRDIKPSNILLAADGQPMLLDFNLAQAKKDNGQAQAAATLGGTVAYMAPEHLRALASRDPGLARLVDQRADIYSLGMVLFEMLVGRSPFDQSASYSPLPALIEAMAVERGRTVPSLRQHRRDVPWGLESIARKCLAPDPADRYQEAEHLAEDLRRFLEDRPLRYAPELSWRERAAKWARRHPRLTTSSAVTAVAALLLLTGANILIGTRHKLEAAQSRAYEAEGAEAREQKKLFEAGHQQALCLVNTATDLQQHVDQGLVVCEQTLALYDILRRDDWQEHRLWRRLAAEERQALAENVRDLLVLLARARVHQASGRGQGSGVRGQESVRQAAFLVGLPPQGRLALLGSSLTPNPQSLTPVSCLHDSLSLLARAESIRGLSPSAALWEDRASFLEQLGDGDASHAARARAASIPPRDVRDYYWRATTLAFTSKYGEAVTALNEALRLNPRHYWSWLQRGICHEELGEHALALGDFNACVALWPEFAWGYFNRGRVLDQLNKKTEALADYNAALQRDSTFVGAYVNRGLIHLHLQQHALALADFDHAAGLGWVDWNLHTSRGLTLENLGRTAEADQAFAKVLHSEPQNARMLVAYGFAVYKRLPGPAAEAFNRVLLREPRNAHALYGLGMLAALRTRSSREAVTLFTQALEADPTFLDARRARANVLAHLGELEAARQDIDWCVKADASGVTLYAAACVYALLAEKCHRPQLAEWCGDRALDLLGAAFERGYGRARAAEDTDLASIQDRPQFQRLLGRTTLN